VSDTGAGADRESLDDPGFEALLGFIDRELSFASNYYKPQYVDRRIRSRIRRTDADSREEYLDLLREDGAEREALQDALSINVTSFFRDEDVWADLRPVLRELSADRRRVRVWSAACSEGREAYSLAAMALSDPEIDADAVRVVGTDIDRESLAAARRGVYRSSRISDIAGELSPLDDPNEYFDVEDGTYTAGEALSGMVSFERHDLIRDDPKPGFDLVLCRNVMIYVDSTYKQPVLETVTESLDPGGYLVLGKTERLPRQFRDAYETVTNGTRIYRRR
jgi:chemotaxis protein methyltransferase CheR